MTPTLCHLSRAYLALPGAPKRDMISDELSASNGPGCAPRLRDADGLLWTADPAADHLAPWALDLTDDATAGVMAGRLHRAGIWFAHVHSGLVGGEPRTWGYWLENGRDNYVPGCAYAGEFAARVAVAAGRAG